VDLLISYLNNAGAGRGRAAGPGAFGRGAGAPAAPVPAELVVGSGGAATREAPALGRGGRGQPAYPADAGITTPQYVINEYGTIGIMMKPPFTKLNKYDLNKGTIEWSVGLGDDARLAAEGIHDTGVPQMRVSVLPTAGGLVFALGGDNKVYAFDSDTGKILWSGDVGGSLRGSASIYEIDGRQYVLVPSSAQLGANQGLGTTPKPGAPAGWVTFALPQN
jgi:quinoprotein glucose dehydrogenase